MSSLLPLRPSRLQLSPCSTLATRTSLLFQGFAKHDPSAELCTSRSVCLEHSRCLCSTFPPFPQVLTQISLSQRSSMMTLPKITYTSSHSLHPYPALFPFQHFPHQTYVMFVYFLSLPLVCKVSISGTCLSCLLQRPQFPEKNLVQSRYSINNIE